MEKKGKRGSQLVLGVESFFFSFSFPPVLYIRLTAYHPPHDLGIIGARKAEIGYVW